MAKLFKQEWTKLDLLRRVGNLDTLAGIHLLEVEDGRGRGCRLLDVWTGSGLRFQINADRALDITNCEFKGMPIAWQSASGMVHPSFYEPQGMGWLRSFSGGLFTTAGLDQFGFPSQDQGKELGLHGRISNIPAAQLSYGTHWEGDEYILEISGELRQSTLYDENLVLKRCITTSLGSNHIYIQDTVRNDDFGPSPHMLLYHFNLGFPLVSEHSRLHLQSGSVLPRDEFAQAGLSEWNTFKAPTPNFHEVVYIHKPIANKEGLATIKLSNPALGIAARWRYPVASLPYLYEWKMLGEGHYVVGIEPANCNGLEGRAEARKKGDLPMLQPGESRTYAIDFEVIG